LVSMSILGAYVLGDQRHYHAFYEVIYGVSLLEIVLAAVSPLAHLQSFLFLVGLIMVGVTDEVRRMFTSLRTSKAILPLGFFSGVASFGLLLFFGKKL
jgi:hypothetical protein